MAAALHAMSELASAVEAHCSNSGVELDEIRHAWQDADAALEQFYAAKAAGVETLQPPEQKPLISRDGRQWVASGSQLSEEGQALVAEFFGAQAHATARYAQACMQACASIPLSTLESPDFRQQL